MSDSIRGLASNMVSRKKEGIDPYILFLGAGASISSGCSSMMQIVDDVLKHHATKSDLDKWKSEVENATQKDPKFGDLVRNEQNKIKRTRFFEIWRTLDHDTQQSILKQHLWDRKPSEGYDIIVKLIKKGFIRKILSTNLDNLLEKALHKANMCYSDDFVVLVNGKDRPEVIAKQLNSSSNFLEIIKLHGSLEFSASYAFTPEETSFFENQIESEIYKFINQSLIIVGSSMQDQDIHALFKEKGKEIYFVNSATPEAESESSRILSLRGKGKVIDGKDGHFDEFFRKLLTCMEYEENNVSSPFNESGVNVSGIEAPGLGNIVAHKLSREPYTTEIFTCSSMNTKYKVVELYESKENYSIVPDYLPRKVCKVKNFSPSIALFSSENNYENICQAINENKHIVLLCDAGVGKTTELKQLDYQCSRLHSYCPIFIPLNLYTNKRIKEYFPKNWELIPEKELLVLLDGFDEIESKNINDAIREIEFFVRECPDAHIVVSCRTNFYKIETEEDEGLLNGFTSYILLDLENKEIKKYAKDKLDFKSTYFFDSIYEKDLYPLLKSPFYLKYLVEMYIINNNLSKSKVEIFKNLLKSRIKLDIKHYRTTKELENETKNLMKNLEHVALAMECLGRNYIDNEELEEILPERSSRELLKYCTTWVKQEIDQVTWQFEHNNFQEYLAAKKLANYPIEVIKEFVSSENEHEKIALSWVNTLSFLVSIYGTDDLQKWILSVQPELFVKFEYNTISRKERIRIFKEIFESYEEKEIWIPLGKFRIDELARFGQSDEIVDYLLNKIEKGAHFTTIGTAIELLCEIKDIPTEYKERAKDILIARALETSYNGIVQNYALECLSVHKFDSKEIIDQIVPSLRRSKDDNIRSGLYRLLCNSDYLNDYIDIFLEGVDCAYSRKIFSFSEFTYLMEGFNKANSPKSIRKIVEFFRKEPENLENIYFNREIGFLDNAAQVYMKDPSILESCLELFKVLLIGHEKQAQNFLRFFDNTNSRLQVFQKIYSERNVEKYAILNLGTLADMDCIEFYVKEYEEGRITDSEIWKLQNSLAFENKQLCTQFNKLIVDKFGDKFALPPNIDYEKVRIEGVQRDVELIFNKELFLEEIVRIFKISKKEKLTRLELSHVGLENFEDNVSKLIIHLLYKIAGDKTVSLEEAIEYINGLNWDSFVIGKVYEMSIRDEDISLTLEQKRYVSEWCLSHVHDVDFRKVISKKDNRIITDRKAILLWYFLRKFGLFYPVNVLLDLISFDSSDLGTEFVGIEYLERRLPLQEMKKRILENLNEGIEYDFILENHIIFCKNHRIKQILQFTPDIITDVNRAYSVRKIALDITIEMSEDLDELEVILTKINDAFKWVVLKTLIDNNKNCEVFLLNTYNEGNENDKLEASIYLMKSQNIKGIELLIEWIKENEKYPWFIGESPLRSLSDSIFVPGLLNLLKISYQENISQDSFHSLHNDVLEALSRIAMNSERNLSEIKSCIENFITENSSNIKNINFLYSYLENLELNFSETRNKDINYVIAKFQDLNITI
ncbi:NACHT domain-containing protein [Methanosarcina acetivorans]|nr:NACHT domain-containing NTPase [Methanosarcina acetivorans]